MLNNRINIQSRHLSIRPALFDGFQRRKCLFRSAYRQEIQKDKTRPKLNQQTTQRESKMPFEIVWGCDINKKVTNRDQTQYDCRSDQARTVPDSRSHTNKKWVNK